ncbi:unnamed protein product [Rhizophagus irregularis]|nr:unnamed protein product [Rhizophagus irregularis]
MCELLWSDPQPQPGRGPSKRGVGIQFGPDVTENFLKRNNLELLIRSHEVKENGYVIEHNGKCITVFFGPKLLLDYKPLRLCLILIFVLWLMQVNLEDCLRNKYSI